MFTLGSLFSGIGGLDIGLEAAGFVLRWQVENDDFCRKVLAKHWPRVPRFGDVRSVEPRGLEPVDIIAGGFPCQDVSQAGQKLGITAARSGLWREFARLVCGIRPRFVLVENTAGLVYRGMGRVLGDLAALGYDAEWSVLSACAMGAPHTRERLFVLAYPAGSVGPQGIWARSLHRRPLPSFDSRALRADWMDALSRVHGNINGAPNRVDRIASLGNAVVPQCAEFIGRRLIQYLTAEDADFDSEKTTTSCGLESSGGLREPRELDR